MSQPAVTNSSAPKPRTPFWMQVGQACFWLGAILFSNIPVLAHTHGELVTWSQLDWRLAAGTFGTLAMGCLILLVGWLRQPCTDTVLNLGHFPRRPDGAVLGPVVKELCSAAVFLVGISYPLILILDRGQLVLDAPWLALIGYQTTCMSWFLLYQLNWYPPERHRATTTYINTFSLSGEWIIAVAWPLLILRNLTLQPLPSTNDVSSHTIVQEARTG